MDAEAGGGAYTYEQTVLRSILSHASQTNHSFVVFTRARFDLTRLPKLSESVEIICIPAGSLARRAVRAGITLLGSKIPGKLGQRWRTNFLDVYARKHQIEFLIFFGTYHKASDIPYLTVVWDLQHRLQPWFPEVSANGIWDKRENVHTRLLQRSAVLICGTSVLKHDLEQFYCVPSDRIKILPMPTPTFCEESYPDIDGEFLERCGLSSKKYLLYPAAFNAHKNHVNLLYAFKKLICDHQIEMQLALTGNGRNLSYAQELVHKLDLSDFVLFLGFRSKEELKILYKNAFALVFVSFFGPDNLPPLEAFAHECPVIVSDVSGHREQLADAALFVDPRSPSDIAAAVKAIHDDENLRERLIERGRARAIQNTGDDFIEGIFKIMDEFEPIRRCWLA